MDPTYSEADPPLLDRSIFDSPRFFYVPVFKIQPNFGGSSMYSIIDFRPAFITDEVPAPTTTRLTDTATDENGSGSTARRSSTQCRLLQRQRTAK